MGLVEMDKEQFDELIMTLIQGFSDVKDSIKSLEKISLNQVEKIPETVYDDDYIGIPLDSVHHPKNPSMMASPTHKWDASVNMWRK